MAHFAKLDENNIVTEVIVVANGDLLDENGNESEQKGIEFCQNLFGKDTKWVQTSYNKNFRSVFAGQGYLYNPERDIFVPPTPHTSWIYNEEENKWEAPVPMPRQVENCIWNWNESDLKWDPIYLKMEQLPLPPTKPFESWILNEEKNEWEAPIPYPTDGNSYIWNEETLSWDLV